MVVRPTFIFSKPKNKEKMENLRQANKVALDAANRKLEEIKEQVQASNFFLGAIYGFSVSTFLLYFV